MNRSDQECTTKLSHWRRELQGLHRNSVRIRLNNGILGQPQANAQNTRIKKCISIILFERVLHLRIISIRLSNTQASIIRCLRPHSFLQSRILAIHQVTWATHFYLTEATRAACFRRTGLTKGNLWSF